MAALEGTIQYIRQAIAELPESHPDRVRHLWNLGAAFQEKYQITGQTENLDHAIDYLRQAVEASAAAGEDQGDLLRDLGSCLCDRYLKTGQIDSLISALGYIDEAIMSASTDALDRLEWMQDSARVLVNLHHRTHEAKFLDQAVQLFEEIHSWSLRNPLLRATALHDLGAVLCTRYELKGQVDDLTEGVKCLREAVAATPSGHSQRVSRLRQLGVGLRFQYIRSGQPDDLNQAIHYLQQALEAAEDDRRDVGIEDPGWASIYFTLGLGLRDRYRQTKRKGDLDDSTEMFWKSCSYRPGIPADRISAGMEAIQNLVYQQDWGESARITEKILQILPQMTSPTSSRNDLQHFLQRLSGFASRSASIFLKAGKPPVAALQALEQGRGIIASHMMDAKSEASEVNHKHPQIWSRYVDCQKQLTALNIKQNLEGVVSATDTYQATSDKRQKIAATFADLQNEIRQCPGFERFLLPLTEKELGDLAQDGSVVCLNVNGISSEAFLITTGGVQVLDLPDLDPDNVRRKTKLFASRGNSSRRDVTLFDDDEEQNEQEATEDEEETTSQASEVLSELQSLWVQVVRPVLSRLGHVDQKHAPGLLPRIWWVGGGQLALMPLHAAGDHQRASTENSLHHVVSSYIPTLKALQYTRKQPAFSFSKPDDKHEILIVSMPYTPGSHHVLNVDRETAEIETQSRSWASVNSLRQPGKSDVLKALDSCTIAHFACHASANPMEPSKSALLLGRETLELLTLEDMDPARYRRASIAYLSACSTAEIRAPNLIDESVHLAAIFQLAGFAHVVGTLWAAHDDAAVEVAGAFYKNLNSFRETGVGSVGHALHDAVLQYRNKADNILKISQWASFIHLGC